MKILFVASECAPFVKTGGLADVVSALPKALAEADVDVKVLLPGYPGVIRALKNVETVVAFDEFFWTSARLVSGTADGLSILALDAPGHYDRPGNPYLGPDGRDWPDNWRRYGALCRIAADIALGNAGDWTPDIVHLHDWQSGLVPVYLQDHPAPPTIMTIHNLAFQGVFPPSVIEPLALPPRLFGYSGYEYYGSVSFLKGALALVDRITTVSPTYAREIMTPEFGFGMDGLLRHRSGDVTGILNGIDLDTWDPAHDDVIIASYDGRRMKGKSANRAALEGRFGFDPEEPGPIFCVVSRLSSQKGIDLLIEAIPRLVAAGGKLAVLGSGDRALEDLLRGAASINPSRVGVEIGYDEDLSHLMQAGSDAILIPSRFEPCGLTQLYGLRYGTLPVVARTGGLADTVIDLNDAALATACGTGFVFSPTTATALGDAIERACSLYSDKQAWNGAVRRGMRQPVGWNVSAARYIDLYTSLLP